jgi:hypothetical protein
VRLIECCTSGCMIGIWIYIRRHLFGVWAIKDGLYEVHRVR